MMPSALSTRLGRKCAERSLCRTSSDVALAKAEARNEGQLLEKTKRKPHEGVLVGFSKVSGVCFSLPDSSTALQQDLRLTDGF